MLQALLAFVLPVLVLFAGFALQKKVKGPSGLTLAGLEEKLRGVTDGGDHFKAHMLHKRIWGYNLKEVDAFMQKMEGDGRELYIKLLWWDLLFPLFYGLALIWGLYQGRELMDQPFHVIWCWLPLISMIADWTENGLLLHQFLHYEEGQIQSLNAISIGVAGLATMLKMISIVVFFIFLAWLTLPKLATTV